MLLFHGGDACLVCGTALLQAACGHVIGTIPGLSRGHPTERTRQLDRVLIEAALIKMKKDRICRKVC